MKTINRIFAFGMAFAALLSCSKAENAAPKLPEETGNHLSITAGTESKTVLRNGDEVQWSSTDKLLVFDNENACVQFDNVSAESPTATATFSTSNWTGKTPVIALHSGAELGNHSYDGSKVTAYLNPTQKIVNKSSYSKTSALSVGVISDNGSGYVVGEMKNCFALLKLTFSDATVQSVVMTGNNDEILAGWADITYNSGNPTWAVNASKAGSKSIKAFPEGSGATNNAFATTVSYYIAVYPQTLSKGFTITMTRADGKSATRTINSSVTLQRSVIKEFEATIDQGLTWVADDIIIDCTNAGKFVHEVDGSPVALTARTSSIYSTVNTAFDFWLTGKEEYVFNGAVTNWSPNHLGAASNSPVKLPFISGYILKEVDITSVKHSSNRTYKVTDGTNDLGSITRNSSTTEETKIDLTNPSTSPETNDRYLVCTGEMGCRFILTYTPAS